MLACSSLAGICTEIESETKHNCVNSFKHYYFALNGTRCYSILIQLSHLVKGINIPSYTCTQLSYAITPSMFSLCYIVRGHKHRMTAAILKTAR